LEFGELFFGECRCNGTGDASVGEEIAPREAPNDNEGSRAYHRQGYDHFHECVAGVLPRPRTAHDSFESNHRWSLSLFIGRAFRAVRHPPRSTIVVD
jgi:hypothetical protein